MVNLAGIRVDIVVTFILTIIFEIVLIIKRAQKNKKFAEKKKRDILVWNDILFSIATSATLYGGLSAIYYSIYGKLLFNQSMIISQEYIILFSGFVLIGFAVLAYKKAIKDIKEGKNEKD